MSRNSGPPIPTGRALYRAFALSANATASSFASRVPTATQPVTVAVTSVVLAEPWSYLLNIMPFGVGTDGTTFSIRFIGWRQINDPTLAVPRLWIPQPICELSCTLSTPQLGVATSPVVATEFFCDAISVVNGIAVVPTTAADTAARAIIDITGYQLIEATFDMTGATSGNFLYER